MVSKASPLSELSLAQIRRAYLGDAVDVSVGRLLPFNRALSTAERITFDRVVLGMSPDEVGRYWTDRKIRGQSGAPRTLEPGDIYQRVVGKLTASVGYVRLDEVLPDVKVVRVDGKLPTDPGYPIGL